MSRTSLVEKVAATPIARALRRQETFAPADIAYGYFMPDDADDAARLSRTSEWLLAHCNAMWRRSVDQRAGRLVVAFEDKADADSFRAETAKMPGMIFCQ